MNRVYVFRALPSLLARLSMAICMAIHVDAHASTDAPATKLAQGNSPMTNRATGSFEVKLAPLDPYNKNENAAAGRMSLDKTFNGDLQATSKGEMLTAGTASKGSAGYVAIERVTGTLNGKYGSFALQHSGTMHRGTFQLSVTVVPDSGTDQLAGLAGKMAIIIANGKHTYEFDYTIGAAP